MKLAYKIGGIGLAGGASVGAYLLIPSSTVEQEVPIQSIDDAPQPLIAKVNAKWEKSFTDKEYEPLVSFGDTSQLLGLLDAYKNENNIQQDSIAGDQLANLCNSFREKEDLEESDKAKAKRWCFKPRTVENILKSQKRQPIYKIQGENRVWDKATIQNLAREYMRNDNPKLKMVASWEEGSLLLEIRDNQLNGDLDGFKKACEIVLDVKSFEDKVDEKIAQANRWCTEAEAT